MKAKERALVLALMTAAIFFAFDGPSIVAKPGPALRGARLKSQGPEPSMHTLQEIYAKLNELIRAPVVQTGQEVARIPGDDGDLRKGLEWPDPRFTDNGNGTVTDNLTGLVWDKNADRHGDMLWAEACSACAALADNQADLTDGSRPGDWRLPNVREMLSLIDYSQFRFALPQGHPFIIVESATHWTSTTTSDQPDAAYKMNTIRGRVHRNFKDGQYGAWCIRDKTP
jgi:hypothetical protein